MRSLAIVALIVIVVVGFLGMAAFLPAMAGAPFTTSPHAIQYGGHLPLSASQPDIALQAAAGIGIDWVAVTLDWKAAWPDGKSTPNFNSLHSLIATAQSTRTKVLINITNAPGWAMTPLGPDAHLTARLITGLARIYPGLFQAVSLFPGANTAAGWGSPPDSTAYAGLLTTVHNELEQAGLPIAIVAGGLTPVSTNPDHSTIDEADFLKQLYLLDAIQPATIIGVHYQVVSPDMLSDPANDPYSVRHYEQIRQVMLDFGHRDGSIWITRLPWLPEAQVTQPEWLIGSLRHLRAQLFIGAIFFDGLEATASSSTVQTLIQPDGSLNPIASPLANLIAETESIETQAAGDWFTAP